MATKKSSTKRSGKKPIVGYVDGFVLVVPKKKVAAYRKMAREAGDFWIRHGALSYNECIGDDLSPDAGGYAFLPFPKLVKLKSTETVWYSYIEYTSKKHRDQVNKKVMKQMGTENKNDPNHMKKMPFDMKRLSYAGFKVAVRM